MHLVHSEKHLVRIQVILLIWSGLLENIFERDWFAEANGPDVVCRPVVSVVAQACQDGVVEDSARRDVARAAVIRGEADLVPFGGSVLQPPCPG